MIVGYNFYVNGEKVNAEPVPATYTIEGLASGTPYPVYVTAVDGAGLESPFSPLSTFTTPTIDVPTSGGGADVPMDSANEAIVDSIVNASMAESGQPGVALALSCPGRGYLIKAYGTTGDGKRALTKDDHFRIGSTTKSFTAVAFFMAVDDGLITFDDVLSKYISDIPNGDRITMRNLLSMRSGLYDYQSNSTLQLRSVLFPTIGITDDQVLSYIRKNDPYSEPGSTYQYNNGNFRLIGMILEQLRGRPIRDIILDDIVGPLGMTQTTWPLDNAVPEPAARKVAMNPEIYGCAGAMCSTVGDLLLWGKELHDHTLISDAVWQTQTSFYWPQPATTKPSPTLFGYGIASILTGTCPGHDGAIPQWGTNCTYDLNSGAVFIVCENVLTKTPLLACYTTIFRNIADRFYPGSMDTPAFPNKVFGIPSQAAVGEPVVGHNVLFSAVTGRAKALGNPFPIAGPDAKVGDCVVLDLVADRPMTFSNIKYDGVNMTLVDSVNLNNNPAYGGGTLYRYKIENIASAGIKSITGNSTGSGWNSSVVIALKNVLSVGATTKAFGKSSAMSHGPTTRTQGTLLLHTFAQAGGGIVLSNLVGGVNRVNDYGSSTGLSMDTSMTTTTFSATAAGKTPAWGSLTTVFN